MARKYLYDGAGTLIAIELNEANDNREQSASAASHALHGTQSAAAASQRTPLAFVAEGHEQAASAR